MTPLRKRLRYALAIYLLIGAAAWFTLDGQFRWIVLILIAGLAVKSWIGVRREELL